MKKLFLTVLFGLLSISGELAQGKINVTVEGLRNTKGKVYVMLQNSEQMYQTKGKYYKAVVIEINNGGHSCTFDDVPAGTYVVTTLHDEDLDKEMKTNFVGMPKEGFGFSNNAKGKMGKPSFEAASFKVEDGKTTQQKIKFIYL